MRIKIPINWLDVKKKYAEIRKLDVEGYQKLFWKKDNIVEFWMEGFNDNGLDEAFLHIVEIYDKILHKDPQWHYFYEGHYSLIRCSYKYCYDVKKYMDDNSIEYKWPIQNWKENTHMTHEYQHIYRDIFHSFSTLIIEMFKNEDGDKLYLAADRVCHPFFNHAMYLADISGKLDMYKDSSNINIMMWEADQMSQLTIYRAHHIGQIDGHKLAFKQMRESTDEETEK